MRVLFIHNQYRQPGGEDVALELESTLLKERGHEVTTVLFSNDEAAGFGGALRSGMNAIYNKRSAQKVKEAIKEFKPDIIHVHNWFFAASPSVFYAASKEKLPVIMTIHNYRMICANALLLRDNHPCELCVNKTYPVDGIRYKCYRNSASQSALVTAITSIHKSLHTWQRKVNNYIVLTPFAKSRLAGSSFKVEPERMIIKPNFIPDPGQGTLPREDFFLFAGRLSVEKGVHVLMQAFSALPDAKLVVIGEGEEKESLIQQYASAGNITFAGKRSRPELLDMMKKCRAVIFPSIWYEGLPFIILEAFATGTPVIASQLGAMAEAITHGYNGLHFVPGDVDGLRQAVQTAAQTSPATEQMYANARATYLEKYHPDIHYTSILSIYEKTIANSKSSNG
ncbi:MAG: glycosyltransferase family 4 protein [Chitinophagaceae bacterium]